MSTPAPVPLRHSMTALHTWAGVVLGSVLFAVFWMGTLAVFDREIDRWMMPATRLGPAPAVSLDAAARRAAELAPNATQWSVAVPTERTPTLQLRYPGPDGSVLRHVDPSTGAALDPPGTLGGTGFIFPFHFTLHIGWLDIGIWLVGLGGMAMLVLVVSGVIIHRRIFRDFFMFRPGKALTRSTLDLHTAMGVLAMPFHFIMPLSGLIIFFSLFFPGTWQAVFDNDRGAFNREVFGAYQRPKANAPARLASLDAMVAEAERRWSGRQAQSVRVLNPGDAASVVEVRRSPKDEVSMTRDTVFFDGTTGAVLERFESKPVGAVQRFISGIHFVQFDNWLLRWLYFAGGLAGCVMIATGFLFWLESRRAEHERQRLRGVRVVEALAIGSITGIILATLAFFVANRCLPAQAAWLGLPRAQLEMLAFYAVWLATFGHAAWRARAAWGEQCALIAATALLTAPLNWLTTGDHPLRALAHGVPAVVGMDALLWCLAGLGFVAARRLSRRKLSERSQARALGRRLEEAGAAAPSKVAHG